MARKKTITLEKVAIAAQRCKPPYVLGTKVLIARVASELSVPVSTLAPLLLGWQKEGRIRLARIDLVAAFDSVPSMLRRSRIAPPGATDDLSGWDAIDLAGFG